LTGLQSQGRGESSILVAAVAVIAAAAAVGLFFAEPATESEAATADAVGGLAVVPVVSVVHKSNLADIAIVDRMLLLPGLPSCY
jgi:hypothetical protein